MANQRAILTLALLSCIAGAVLGDHGDGKPARENQQSRSIFSAIHQRFHPKGEGKVDPLPSDYQSRHADSKQEMLWKRIEKTAYDMDKLPTASYTPEELAPIMRPEHHVPSFTHVSDEIPEGRKKLSHRYAVVGKVQLEILDSSPYTGILDSPGGVGLARLSLAKLDDPNNISPDMAIKILINGKPSVNFHTFFDSNGQGNDTNPFLRTKTNVVPNPNRPPLLVLDKVFTAGLKLIPGPDSPPDSKTLGLVEIASVKASGEKIAEPVVPWKIVWVPNPALTASFTNRTKDFRIELAEIPENTVLFDAVAYRQKDSEGMFIGRLITRSELIASQYGDEVLFFQHALKRWVA